MNMHQIILVGRATRDAEEIKSKSKKNSFAKFSVAVNEYRGEDQEEKTYFYDILVFGKNADNVVKNIKKGDTVMAMGKPEVDVYVSKNKEAKGNIIVLAESWRVLK